MRGSRDRRSLLGLCSSPRSCARCTVELGSGTRCLVPACRRCRPRCSGRHHRRFARTTSCRPGHGARERCTGRPRCRRCRPCELDFSLEIAVTVTSVTPGNFVVIATGSVHAPVVFGFPCGRGPRTPRHRFRPRTPSTACRMHQRTRRSPWPRRPTSSVRSRGSGFEPSRSWWGRSRDRRRPRLRRRCRVPVRLRRENRRRCDSRAVCLRVVRDAADGVEVFPSVV